jgi:hypothetical protein
MAEDKLRSARDDRESSQRKGKSDGRDQSFGQTAANDAVYKKAGKR